MNEELPTVICKGEFRIQKFTGKGGWSFVQLPDLSDKNIGGWQALQIEVDNFLCNDLKIFPMGKGRFFIALKAEIRKKIGKNEGDTVQIHIYTNEVAASKSDFFNCLNDAPDANKSFLALPKKEQEKYIEWIFQAKGTTQIVNRMVSCIDKLNRGEKINF